MPHRALTSFHADDGERIHLAIAGTGDPVVMLHGWTASHEEWFPFLDPLTPHHRVYRWDARGHGGHRPVTSTLPTVQRMARDLRNLLQHYNLAGATLVGHSMGALTVWEYIRHYGTGGLGRVCLIDQSPRLLTADDWEHGIYGDFDEERSRHFIAALEDDFAEAVLRLGAYGLNTRARAKYEQNARGWQRVREGLKQLNPPCEHRAVRARPHAAGDPAHLRGHRPFAAPVAARTLRAGSAGFHRRRISEPPGCRKRRAMMPGKSPP
ncbi:MAG: alpha/beta hydrolase fold [Proteobacteria bacterium]|nr:alpha/beta hydrolase fold [Pseudomonadota bacterium]